MNYVHIPSLPVRRRLMGIPVAAVEDFSTSAVSEDVVSADSEVVSMG